MIEFGKLSVLCMHTATRDSTMSKRFFMFLSLDFRIYDQFINVNNKTRHYCYILEWAHEMMRNELLQTTNEV